MKMQPEILAVDGDAVGATGRPELHRAGIESIRVGDIELDPTRRTVKKCGQRIHLTPTEFELTHYLMSNAGRPIRHMRLLNAVWGTNYGRNREYLRTFMRQLRIKLEDDPANPRYLLTDAWFGYRFADEL
jgi:two-component system, OmpR family, KDP operon response regulator KdpE